MTDTTIDARIASRVHAFGIANVLAMLSDLALSDPVDLAETVAGDLPAPQRWQEARARSGWPVRLDDLIHDLGLAAAPEAERRWVEHLWDRTSMRAIDTLAGPLAQLLQDLADPAAADGRDGR